MSKVNLFSGGNFETVVILLTFIPLYSALALLLLVLGLPALCIRYIVAKLALKWHPDWVGLMTGKDVIVGADNLDKPRNVLMWYNTLDGSVGLDEIRQKFSSLIVERHRDDGSLMYPKYKQYFESWWGYNFWKWDHHFDIKNNIKYLFGCDELTVSTERQVLTKLGRLVTAPFPRQRPYWECYCVPNYIPHGSDPTVPKTLVVYRVHHGVGDGYSFLKCFMQHLCNDDLEKMVKLKLNTGRGNLLTQALQLSWTFIKMPYCLVRQCLIDVDRNEWFLPNDQLTGISHVAQTRQISIPEIKLVCKDFNVTFTSVLFSALAGGINKYFKRKYFGSKEVHVPQIIRCFTPFPWRNHPNNKLTNHWTCATVPLFPSIDSAQERMILTEQYLQTLKQSPIPLANHFLLPVGAVFPVWLVRFGNWFNTAIVSNFPGPTQHVYYYKRYRVEDLNFWAPHLNGKAGIGVTMISYGDVIRIGLNFDQAILPRQQDVNDICIFIEKEFEKLFRKKAQIIPLVPKKLDDEPVPNQEHLQRKILRHRSVS